MKISDLEKSMVKYQDLVYIPVKDNGEKMVSIDPAIIPVKYLRKLEDMKILLKNKIYVRKSVYQKLLQVQKKLSFSFPNLSLLITYGYRSIEVQVKYFKKQSSLLCQKKYFDDPLKLYEEVHRYIAVPAVAGHPTGGAVDVTLIDIATQKILDFGSEMYDFTTKNCYTFSTNISKVNADNRMLLRTFMLNEGFAPFDGEWWHYSYGDKEWAYYFKKKNAKYRQKEFII